MAASYALNLGFGISIWLGSSVVPGGECGGIEMEIEKVVSCLPASAGRQPTTIGRNPLDFK